MRVRIAKNWWERYVSSQIGRTWAEKLCHAERAVHGNCAKWAEGMRAASGKWVEVETEYLFEDQFNIAKPSVRLELRLIDAIDFGPEFKHVGEFEAAVKKRYEKDWPGREATCHALRHYILHELVEVVQT